MSEPVLPCLRAGWRDFWRHPQVFTLAVLVLSLSWVALELAVVALHRYWVGINILLHLAFLVAFSGLTVGVHVMALRAADGKPPAFRNLTSFLDRGPDLLLAGILYIVVVTAGLIFLVAPGVYLGVRYALFGQVIAERKVSAIEAFRQAGRLTSGQWWRTFRLVLMIAGLNLAGAALLGVGLIVTYPVAVLAASRLYRELDAGSHGRG